MKKYISVEIKTNLRLPKETLRLLSKKYPHIYYEFTIPSEQMNDDFEVICREWVKELDEGLTK